MQVYGLMQQARARQQHAHNVYAEGRARAARDRRRRTAEDLEDQIDQLVLVVEAMWDLLSERLGVTEEELVTRVVELDAASGAVDGRRATPPPITCRGCGAKVGASLRACQFCGTPADRVDPFSI